MFCHANNMQEGVDTPNTKEFLVKARWNIVGVTDRKYRNNSKD